MGAVDAEGSGTSEASYLSRGEAARRLGVPPRTIQQWAKEGRIPCIRTFGGHRRFAVEDLDTLGELLKNRRPRRRTSRAVTPGSAATTAHTEAAHTEAALT